MSDIIDELSWRGLVAISTDLEELRTVLRSGQVTVYIGFDPTAPSLHIGNLLQILTARRLQLAGHRPAHVVATDHAAVADNLLKVHPRKLHQPLLPAVPAVDAETDCRHLEVSRRHAMV